MTVGISLSNGREAIVIADSRQSMQGRESDTGDKLLEVLCQDFAGTLITAGDANIANGLFRESKRFPHDTIDTYLTAIDVWLKNFVDDVDKRHLASVREETIKKALLLDDSIRAQYVDSTLRTALQEYDERRKRNILYNTSFVFSVVDKKTGIVKAYLIEYGGHTELFNPYFTIGSGGDAANLYFVTKLQGVDMAALAAVDILFFAINAYNQSTANQGVGGTPKIAVISKEGTKVLEHERTLALTNLSGAYLAAGSKRLTIRNTRNAMRGILEAESPQYGIVAELMDTDPKTITGIYIPYSSWQERANRRLFSTKAEQ